MPIIICWAIATTGLFIVATSFKEGLFKKALLTVAIIMFLAPIIIYLILIINGVIQAEHIDFLMRTDPETIWC